MSLSRNGLGETCLGGIEVVAFGDLSLPPGLWLSMCLRGPVFFVYFLTKLSADLGFPPFISPPYFVINLLSLINQIMQDLLVTAAAFVFSITSPQSFHLIHSHS